eukprot:Em0013g954a
MTNPSNVPQIYGGSGGSSEEPCGPRTCWQNERVLADMATSKDGKKRSSTRYYCEMGEATLATQTTTASLIPAMIDDWRAKWYTSSYGNTDPMFPFGFVQLLPPHLTSCLGTERLHGSVHGPQGPHLPYDSIHPRDKLDVGARLALAARVWLTRTDVYFTGAIATGATLIGLQPVTVVVDFTSVGPSGLDLLYPYGFEVQCSGSTSLLEGSLA